MVLTDPLFLRRGLVFALHREPKRDGLKRATNRCWTQAALTKELEGIKALLDDDLKGRAADSTHASSDNILQVQLEEDRTHAQAMARAGLSRGRNSRRESRLQGVNTRRSAKHQRERASFNRDEGQALQHVLEQALAAVRKVTNSMELANSTF